MSYKRGYFDLTYDNTKSHIMAGIKDYTSMNYYSSVNNRMRFRKPLLFSKGKKFTSIDASTNGEGRSYREESIGFKAIKLLTLGLLFSIIAIIAYINFSYFVAVL